jgi:hypothetical protein
MQRYHKEWSEFNRNEQVESTLAPEWAEASAPRNLLNRVATSLLLIRMPDAKGEWQVATSGEIDAVANPESYLGRLLRPHCALMAVPYLSNN